MTNLILIKNNDYEFINCSVECIQRRTMFNNTADKIMFVVRRLGGGSLIGAWSAVLIKNYIIIIFYLTHNCYSC